MHLPVDIEILQSDLAGNEISVKSFLRNSACNQSVPYNVARRFRHLFRRHGCYSLRSISPTG
jgi:hypothetical protein